MNGPPDKAIPDTRFRLPHRFAALPTLTCDPMTDKGLLIGQNSTSDDIDAIFIGKHAEAANRNVWMDVRGAHVLYVMGKRRSGKSYTLGALAEGLVSKTWVNQGGVSPAVLILDTMNVFLTMPFAVQDTLSEQSPELLAARRWRLAAEQSEPALYSPAGSETPPGIVAQPITLRASDLGPEEWCALFDVDPFVDPMGHLIATAYARLSTDGGTDVETGQPIPARPHFTIPDMIDMLTRDREVDDFTTDTRNALIRRLRALDRMALFGDHGLDVRDLFAPGQVTVLLLRDLDADMRNVLVSLIVKRAMRLRAVAEQFERLAPVHRDRAERLRATQPADAVKEDAAAAECEHRALEGLPRSWIIIDEAHNYIPARGSVPSKQPLKKYVDEGRNLGLSIVVATQQPSGLDPSIQRNADMLLIHALSHQDDIVAARGMINTAVPDEVTLDDKYKHTSPQAFEAMVRSLPVGYAIASTDRANRLFPISIRPRTTIHGGGDY